MALDHSQGLQGCFDYFVGHVAEANKLSEHRLVLSGDPVFHLDVFALKYLGQAMVDRLRQAVAALAE